MIEAFANHLWQSTLFVLLVAALSLLFRKDGAHIRYWLWWIASVKFLVPFSALTAIGMRLVGDASVGFVPEMFTVTAEVVARPFTNTDAWTAGKVLLGIWATGSLLLIARWIAGSVRLRQALANATADRAILVDGRRAIPVYRSGERVEPGIVGIFRPVLLLPEGIDNHLSPAKLEAVLSHELGHVRRHDNLLAAVHMLVETLFWFHPFVWWIGARLIDERERACDELVVAAGHDPEIYAEGILDVCEHYAASPLRCAAGISGSDLKRRVTQIMRYRGMNSLKLAKKFLLGMAGVIALAVPLMAGFVIDNAAVAQSQTPTPDAPGDDFMPIVKVAPVYPPRAAARGLEGFVVVQYTVNETGSTSNVTVVESSSSLFERAAIDSALKYKYQPRIENGVPVAVDGIMTKIVFALNDEELPLNGDVPQDPPDERQGEFDVVTVTGSPIEP
jgi:bla regulator protein BlaR1